MMRCVEEHLSISSNGKLCSEASSELLPTSRPSFWEDVIARQHATVHHQSFLDRSILLTFIQFIVFLRSLAIGIMNIRLGTKSR